MNNIYIIDTETNNKNKLIGNFTANPHYRGNEIVHAGIKRLGALGVTVLDKYDTRGIEYFCADADLLVGQNIKFDLLYLMRDDKFRNEVLPNLRIWDTMQVEYLLSGQQKRFPTLDYLSEKYGGTLKDKRLEEMWAEGVDTEDIDEGIVIPYLEADVTNTELAFKKQLVLANEANMLQLIKSQMDAILATAEMEYNGMYFNKKEALHKAKILSSIRDVLHKSCFDFMKMRMHTDTPNVDSVDDVSLTLFGGQEKVVIDKPILDESGNPVKYKSGARKGTTRTKKETIMRRISSCVHGRLAIEREKKKGFYSVSNDVLKNIYKDSSTHRKPRDFVRALMEYRTVTKDLKTYYKGYSELVWPHDNCIHGTYNHCQTATGRLSHSNPNLGNVSHKE